MEETYHLEKSPPSLYILIMDLMMSVEMSGATKVSQGFWVLKVSQRERSE